MMTRQLVHSRVEQAASAIAHGQPVVLAGRVRRSRVRR